MSTSCRLHREELKPYREWLPANSYEATAFLGGSFYSEEISDDYLTPYDLGYGHMVRFVHDFVGREVLKIIAQNPGRKKATLVWDGEDVSRVFSTLFQREGEPARYIDLLPSWYSVHQYGRVKKDDETIGVSTCCGYSHNERAMLSLACVDVEHSEPGTEVTLLWGEEPNSMKPTIERHVQTEIRATIAPIPIAEFAAPHIGRKTDGAVVCDCTGGRSPLKQTIRHRDFREIDQAVGDFRSPHLPVANGMPQR